MDVTCVVADPQELDRKALIALLRTQPGVRVVGEAATLDAATRELRRRSPAVLIADARTLGPHGASSFRCLRGRGAGVALLGLVRECGQRCAGPSDPCLFDADAHRRRCCGRSDCLGQMLLDGADDVLPRSASTRALFRAVRALARGLPGTPPRRIRRMVACAARREGGGATRSLTAREEQVAGLVGRGCSNREIGERLRITVGTVKKHVGHVLAKLDLPDRLQLGLLVAGSVAPSGAPARREDGTPVSPIRAVLPR